MGKEIILLTGKMQVKDNNFRKLELRVMRIRRIQELYESFTSQEEKGVKKFSDDYIIRCIEEQVFVMEQYIWKVLYGRYQYLIDKYEELKPLQDGQKNLQTTLSL